MIDVVVVGGGPAGLAIAGALAQRGRSVAVLERSRYDRPRVGETLDAETIPLLQSLGAWDVMGPFLEGQVPHRGVRSAWGNAELEDKPSIFHPLGEGRHVERVRFDAALSDWARSVGVSVRTDSGSCVARKDASGFRVEPARGEPVVARWFVDASGRGAPASAKLPERRWLAVDRQIAIVARTERAGDFGFDLLLESAELGWWYSAPQADGTLVVALVTDSDLVATGDRDALAARFREALDETTFTASRCGDSTFAPLQIVRADSGILLPERGEGWCAIGDAAIAGDPLAGNGVARALRGAVAEAPRVDAKLRGEEPPARAPLVRWFLDYLDQRARYYEIEERWPSAPFWARRRPGAWKSAPITLDPMAVLRRGAEPSRDALAPIEALVPPKVLASALEALDGETPAHVFVSELRDAAPVGDRRLLVGVQMLVAQGICAARSTS